MAAKILPPQEFLRERFDYDPSTGQLWRKTGPRAGQLAGSPTRKGYLRVRVDGDRFLCQRVIWKLVTGQEPICQIDHINRTRDDNRWRNLREVDQPQQSANMGRGTRNTSGFKGVVFRKDRNKFIAQIRVRGQLKRVGTYKTPEAAHEAYCQAARELFGEFWCPG